MLCFTYRTSFTCGDKNRRMLSKMIHIRIQIKNRISRIYRCCFDQRSLRERFCKSSCAASFIHLGAQVAEGDRPVVSAPLAVTQLEGVTPSVRMPRVGSPPQTVPESPTGASAPTTSIAASATLALQPLPSNTSCESGTRDSSGSSAVDIFVPYTLHKPGRSAASCGA